LAAMSARRLGKPRTKWHFAKWLQSEERVPIAARKPARLQKNGGKGGIRTHERVTPLAVFKTAAFNRSATFPAIRLYQAALINPAE
jgi:hypothetical protein